MDRAADRLAPRFSWWWFALPIVVSAAVRDLWAPDEPRYAMVSKWIYDHGEFLVLRRCGELYPDKPPLVYWLAGFLGWVSGWSTFAMRLVSIAATLGTARLTELFARRWFGELEARWAPILFLGFALIAWTGGRIALDPLLTLGCVGALYFASANAEAREDSSRQVLLAGLFTGIAAFAKGPVALIHVGLPLALWRWLEPKVYGARSSLAARIGAIALAIGPVLAWAIAAALREPVLWNELFLKQFFERAATGTHHKGPPWEYLVELPIYLLPWTGQVVAGLVDGFRAWRIRRSGEKHDLGAILAGLWFLSILIAFSISPAKREIYLLPLYPAAALLGGRQLVRTLRRGRLARASGLVPILVFALSAFALFASEPIAKALAFAHPELGWRSFLAGLPFAVGAALGWRIFARGQLSAWASGVAVTWAVGGTAVLLMVVPLIDPAKSDRPTADFLRSLPERPSEIACYGTAADGVRFYGGGPCVQAKNSGLYDGDLEARLEREGDQFLALIEVPAWEHIKPATRALLRVIQKIGTGERAIYVLGKAR